MQRNAQFVKGCLQLRVYLPLGALWFGCRIIYYILEIYLRNLQMGPPWHLHLLPPCKGLEPELQHPLWLTLLAGDEPYGLLRQALGNILLLYIGDKALFILLICKTFNYLFALLHFYS